MFKIKMMNISYITHLILESQIFHSPVIKTLIIRYISKFTNGKFNQPVTRPIPNQNG